MLPFYPLPENADIPITQRHGKTPVRRVQPKKLIKTQHRKQALLAALFCRVATAHRLLAFDIDWRECYTDDTRS
jgi:hypothetical protein